MQCNEDAGSGSLKKIPLEDLSQDELVKRCKSLLVIAQKAKSSKDEIAHRLDETLAEAKIREQRLEEKETEVCGLQLKYNELEAQFSRCREELSLREEELRNLRHVTAETKRLEEKSVELESHVAALETLNAELKLKLESCGETSDAKDVENENCRLKEELLALKQENAQMRESFESQKAELVTDMNEMNMVLKQRGESITHLHERLHNQEALFESKIRELQDQLEERGKRIAELETELSQQAGEHNDTMSTSTVSRIEEVHRMRDVEDSLEERYNKLKMLAVKMKKKMAEQSNTIEELQAKVMQASKERENLAQLSKNTQALLKDVDRLQDEVEEKTKQNRVLKKDLEEAISNLAALKQSKEEFKEDMVRLKSSASQLEKAKLSLEESLKAAQAEAEQWKKEKEAERVLRVEISKECSALKSQLANLNASLTQLQQDAKKKSLMDLEIDDFERTVEALKEQLEQKNSELGAVQQKLDQQVSHSQGLAEQIQFLEAQSKSEFERAETLKKARDEAQSQLTSLTQAQKDQETELAERQSRLETLRQQVEKVQLEFSQTSAELYKTQNSLTAANEALKKQVNNLQESLSSKAEEVEEWRIRYAETAAEFDSYKVRAQSVLKQAREKPRTEPEDSGTAAATEQIEREMQQRVVDALKQKINELQAELAARGNEISQLKSERDRAVEMESRATRSAEQRVEQVSSELEAARNEHRAALNRIQMDNQLLISLHKDQLEAMSRKQAKEISELQAQLDQSQVEIVRLQRQLNPGPGAAERRSVSPADPLQVDRLEIVRAEDADDIPPVSPAEVKRTGRKPLPLDLLLSTPMEDDGAEQSADSRKETDRKMLDEAREAALVAERRCRHLAALLAEAEANEARLSQLCEALKEEIRRNQRAEERQKHIENLEYLKNVVLKFVMLPRGEERSRLVPVLTTLLKLSPSEVHQLNNTVQQRAGESPAAAAAWGGIFHLWSGPS